MWSDPDDIETWVMSNRGAGWIFGWKVVNEVNKIFLNLLKKKSIAIFLQFSFSHF
jgi:hypothetical protein